MRTASDFTRLGESGPMVSITFDGRTLDVRDGGNLAGELLAAGVGTFRRSPVSGAPRAPFCMMGACYDCLVSINGVVRQSCMCAVEAGLSVKRAGPEGDDDD